METNLPEVPNFLIWIATLFAVLYAPLVFFSWIWRRYMADWWASRSQDRARAHAIKLYKNANHVESLKDNNSYLISTVTLALSLLIMGISLLMVSIIMIESVRIEFLIKHLNMSGTVADTGEWPYIFQRLKEVWFEVLVFFFGSVLLLRSQWFFKHRISPHMDPDEYFKKLKQRITALLEKAKIPENDWASFLDENWNKTNAAEGPRDD